MKHTQSFGTAPIGKLLLQQSAPASIGILVMSLNMIVDTIFVGRLVGPMAIAAITVVMPIVFLMSSLGMAVGVGGSSIVSRALGAQQPVKANRAYNNMISLTVSLSAVFLLLGFYFADDIINLFGGKGDVLPYARTYFAILLYGVPGLAWAMMANPLIRALGFPRYAMLTMLFPAFFNLVLDYILIARLDMGMAGAAWATCVAYLVGGGYTMIFLATKNRELSFSIKELLPDWRIIREIAAIGAVTLARQGVISVLAIILHNSLYRLGGENALAMYGIASRFMMFALFPMLGITQGFLPIAGYNYGAQLYDRTRESIVLSVKYATIIATVIFAGIMIFTGPIISIFTTDSALIDSTIPVMRWIFLATPLIAINLIGSGFYQAIGRAWPALWLTLSKQGFFLIPLVLILPKFFGLSGIWYSFAIADLGAALLTYWYLKKTDQELFIPK